MGSSDGGLVPLWDVQSGAYTQMVPNTVEPVLMIAISGKSAMILSASSDSFCVRLISSGTLLATASSPCTMGQLSFSHGAAT